MLWNSLHESLQNYIVCCIFTFKTSLIGFIPQSHFFCKIDACGFSKYGRKCITAWSHIRSLTSNEARGTKRVTKHCQGINISIQLSIRHLNVKFCASIVWRSACFFRLNPEPTSGQIICIKNLIVYFHYSYYVPW